MLKLFITPSSIVFEDMSDTLYTNLTNKYNLDFEIDEGEYKVTGTPEQLYKLLNKLSYDYDIELN